VDRNLYGFVRPESGEVFWLILCPQSMSQAVLQGALSVCEFAKEVGAGENKGVLLVVDQAGWQTGKEVEIPEEIHILSLCPSAHPSYSQRRGCGR
jgi:hypothetical protein